MQNKKKLVKKGRVYQKTLSKGCSQKSTHKKKAIKRLSPKNTRTTQKYENSLLLSLKDPLEAATYLSVHLEDNSKYAEQAFLLALQDVAKAYGINNVSRKANLGRESLYKTLSGSVNPKLKTLKSILDSVGLKITVEPKSAS